MRRESIQVTKVFVTRWNIPRRQTLSPQPLSSQPAPYRHGHVSHLTEKWILGSSGWLSLWEILAAPNTWIYRAPTKPKHLLQTSSLPKAALGSLHHTPPQECTNQTTPWKSSAWAPQPWHHQLCSQAGTNSQLQRCFSISSPGSSSSLL